MTTHNDGLILCWNDARKTMYNMIKVLEESQVTTWTQQDVAYLIDYRKKHGVYYGINRDLAEQLGKTYEQVKKKMSALAKEGII